MKRLSIAICIVILALFTAVQAHAIGIGISPSPLNVTEGNTFSVDLFISGLGENAAPSLSTFDVDINHDTSILAFNSALYGDPILGDQLDLFSLGSLTDTTPQLGSVNLFQLSWDMPNELDTLQAGSFTLATLAFDALAPGMSALGISVNALGDSLGDPLIADGIISGTVNVAAVGVPEPATMILLGTGLIGLAGLKRKRLFKK